MPHRSERPASKRLSLAAVALGLPLLAAPALAHHGWGSYDAGQVLTLNGKIQEATYANPHGTLKLETPGKVWLVILAPPFRMQNRGLPSEMLKPGETVTVVGYPSRVDPVEMRAERITVNGQTTELR
jgi:Family of unknown function (DUF6152)